MVLATLHQFNSKKNFGHIELIILKHPHSDHFAGIRPIMEYFAEKRLTIGYFLHTCGKTPGYLKMALGNEFDSASRRETQALFL
jgi:phosphoribosyl 1,2-cyclic phosphodiesterase